MSVYDQMNDSFTISQETDYGSLPFWFHPDDSRDTGYRVFN
jgi:hypothetical protein